jgi:hypothetical protein
MYVYIVGLASKEMDEHSTHLVGIDFKEINPYPAHLV